MENKYVNRKLKTVSVFVCVKIKKVFISWEGVIPCQRLCSFPVVIKSRCPINPPPFNIYIFLIWSSRPHTENVCFWTLKRH